MITRLEIDGFKSFVDFSLDLHPFTAVIGTNASGKSNLIDAFRFLEAALRGDLYDAVDAVRGDAESLLHQYSDGRRARSMRFAVEFEAWEAKQPLRWRYESEIHWEKKTSTLTPRAENLFYGFEGEWVRELDGVRTDLHREARSVSFALMGDGQREAVWAQLGFGVLMTELGSIRASQLETGSLRELSKLGGRPELAPDGFGLPAYLNHLGTSTATDTDPRGLLREIGLMLRGVVPDVTDFDVLEDEDRRDIRIVFNAAGQPPFDADVASGGTLRALAMLAMLADPHQRGPILVDEPENGIYPERLRKLLRVMQQVAEGPEGRQILVASHSPVLLDVVPMDRIVFLDAVSRIDRGRASRVSRARRAVAHEAQDSTSHWAALTPAMVDRLKAGGEMPD